MGGKTKEQLLEELSEVQKMLEERTETQGQMIIRFKTLIENEGLFSQIVDLLPYPLVIFTPLYTLAMTNKAFAAETKMRVMYPEKGAARILQHKINDVRLADAITGVFAWDTFFFEDLKNPFSMFSGILKQSTAEPGRFSRAVIFPVTADDAKITHGVIVLMP